MSGKWMEAIDARSASALADGALLPVQAEETLMTDGGLCFIVRWVSSLAAKDAKGISFGAMCFGGTLYIRNRAQIESIRQVGPLQAMAAVGC